MAVQIDGINVHNDKALEYVNALNCDWVRIDVNWWAVEQTKNNYNWKDIDSQVNYYISGGLKIYASVAYTPKYISANQSDMPSIDRWQAFITQFAKRYSNKIDVVSIWNEPNLKQFFNGTMNDYFHGLLETATPLIRAYAPQMKIAAPELSTLSSTKWWKWLREARHHQALYDIVSIHSYADDVIKCFRQGKVPLFGWLVPKWSAYNKYLKKIDRLVFLTECGYEAFDDCDKAQKNQKKYIEDVQKNKDKANIDTIMFYTLRDAQSFEFEGPFGFYTHDWKTKKISEV